MTVTHSLLKHMHDNESEMFKLRPIGHLVDKLIFILSGFLISMISN